MAWIRITRRDLGGEGLPGAERKARTMKHIVGTALAAVTTLVLLGACVALLAGKDDIRKFHRMRSM